MKKPKPVSRLKSLSHKAAKVTNTSFLMYECSPELVEQAQKMQQWLIIMNRFFFVIQNDMPFRMFTVALNIHTNKHFVWERKGFETIQISHLIMRQT